MLGLASCKQVVKQSSDLLDGELTAFERFKLKIHLFMCKHCRNYVKQMRLTSETVNHWMKGRKMPAEVRQRILDEFENGVCHNAKKDEH